MPHEASKKTSSWKFWSGWPFSPSSTPSHDRRANSSDAARLTFGTPNVATIRVASKETPSPALDQIEDRLATIEKRDTDVAAVVPSWRAVVREARALREFEHWFNNVESSIEGYRDGEPLVLKIEQHLLSHLHKLEETLQDGMAVMPTLNEALAEAVSLWRKECEDFKRLVETAKEKRAAFEQQARQAPLTSASSNEEREMFYGLEQNANALESAVFRARETTARACKNFEEALISHLPVPKEILPRSSSPSMLTAAADDRSSDRDSLQNLSTANATFNSVEQGEEHDHAMTRSRRESLVSIHSSDEENDQMSHASIGNSDDEDFFKKNAAASVAVPEKSSTEEVVFEADRESIEEPNYGDGTWVDIPDSEEYLASLPHEGGGAVPSDSVVTSEATPETLRALSLVRARELRTERLRTSREHEAPTGERLLQDFRDNASHVEKVGTLTRLIAVAHDKLREAREALKRNTSDNNLSNSVEDAEYVYEEGRAALAIINNEEQVQTQHRRAFAPSLKKLAVQPKVVVSPAGTVLREPSAARLIPTTSSLLERLMSESLARKKSGAPVSSEALLMAFPEREKFVQRQKIKTTLEQLRSISEKLSFEDQRYLKAEIDAVLQQLESAAE